MIATALIFVMVAALGGGLAFWWLEMPHQRPAVSRFFREIGHAILRPPVAMIRGVAEVFQVLTAHYPKPQPAAPDPDPAPSEAEGEFRIRWYHVVVLIFVISSISNAINRKKSSSSRPRASQPYSLPAPNPGDHYVRPHLRDGTAIDGYYRTNPDSTTLNNYSGPYGSTYRQLNGR